MGAWRSAKGQRLRATTSRAVEEPAVWEQSLMWEQTQPAPKHLGLGERHRGHGRAWGGAAVVSDAGCHARGSGWARGPMLVCAEGLFAPTHLAPPFNPAPESLCPRNLPVCRLGVNSLVGAARAFRTSGRGGAGAVCVCLWRSCTSGVQCMAQLAVGGRCGARGRRVARKGRASGASHTGDWGWGPASGVFRGTLQLELVN